MRALPLLRLTSLLMLAAPNIAYPCGNGVYLRTNEATQLVAKAERALEKNQNRRVLQLLADEEIEFDSMALNEKRMALVGIANVRVGKVAAGLASLRWLAERKPSPVIEAWLAEGLAKDRTNPADSRAEALKILEKLEKDDLLPDAKAAAVLASLRRGDAPKEKLSKIQVEKQS